MNKDIMTQMGFGEQVHAVDCGLCPTCGEKINIRKFRDDLSLEEYTISGMCQLCQDAFFASDEINLE